MAQKTNKYIIDSDEEASDSPTSHGIEKQNTSKKRKIDTDSEDTADTKTAKTAKDIKNEKASVFEITQRRKVTVNAFSSGGVFVDIREFYTDKAGESKPGKGICLPVAQYKLLKQLLPKIDAAVERLSES
ncbi:hypothetical protein BDF14DRAFT_1171527 [Spinellus fusiger]|nr:hypothetical protein BDF14DRAFT_1171527 [Spinellus fusiger]